MLPVPRVGSGGYIVRTDAGIPLIHGHIHERGFGTHEFHVGVDAFDSKPVPMSVVDGPARLS